VQYIALGETAGGPGITLVANTAKTVVAFLAAEKSGGQLIEFAASFPATAANEPVLIELVKFSGESAGTATEVTLAQVRGSGADGGSGIVPTIKGYKNFTAEPTVATVLKAWKVSPTSGIVYQAPLGREIELPPKGSLANTPLLGLRMLATVEVKVTAYMELAHGPS
jgi:hypothetical protein